MIGSWVFPHYVLYTSTNDKLLDEFLPAICGISIGCMTLALAIRISMFRTEMNVLDSIKLVESTDRFKRWHKTQMNNAEYYPLFASLHFMRQILMMVPITKDGGEKPYHSLSQLGMIGCYMSLVSNYGIVVASTQIYGSSYFVDTPFERLLRKGGFARFLRMIPITFRYIALAILLADITLVIA